MLKRALILSGLPHRDLGQRSFTEMRCQQRPKHYDIGTKPLPLTCFNILECDEIKTFTSHVVFLVTKVPKK